VTNKGSVDQRKRVNPPALLTALLLVCMMSLLWFSVSMAGLTFTNYNGVEPAVIGSALFAAGNLWILFLAITRIRDSSFSGERRASTRFDVFLRARVDGNACIVHNISITGARIETAIPLAVGATVTLALQRVRIQARVLPALAENPDHVRLTFLPDQARRIGDLVLLNLKYSSTPRIAVAAARAA
jgi:hypothetical protein